MTAKGPIEGPSIGFDFSNYARNQHLAANMNYHPRGESSSLSYKSDRLSVVCCTTQLR